MKIHARRCFKQSKLVADKGCEGRKCLQAYNRLEFCWLCNQCNVKVLYPDEFDFCVENEDNETFKFVYGVDGLYTKLKEDYNLSKV
uniref:Uncharacterized protein n=1 Tax=Geoglobus ahangari TaxID=113653 RepID=A0A7C4S762_9EURY